MAAASLPLVRRIDEALSALFPRFGMAHFRHAVPRVSVTTAAQSICTPYCTYADGQIFLHQAPTPLELGDEVGHFLHALINPGLYRYLSDLQGRIVRGTKNEATIEEFVQASNLATLVSRFGSYMYAEKLLKRGEQFECEERLHIAPARWPFGVWDLHTAGADMASELYNQHCDPLLPQLARAERWDDAETLCEEFAKKSNKELVFSRPAYVLPDPDALTKEDAAPQPSEPPKRQTREALQRLLDRIHSYLAPRFGVDSAEWHPVLKFHSSKTGPSPSERRIYLYRGRDDEVSSGDDKLWGIAEYSGRYLHDVVNHALYAELLARTGQREIEMAEQGKVPTHREIYSDPEILKIANLQELVAQLAAFSYATHHGESHHSLIDGYNLESVHPAHRAGLYVAFNVFRSCGDALLLPLAHAPTWEAAERIYRDRLRYRPDFEKLTDELSRGE